MRHVLCTSGLELATISIHALTRSATWPWNPLEKVTIISIHALTRSATSSNRICLNCNRFQSTHSRGVRQLKGLGLRIQGAFQSTHSRGVRLRNQDGVLWVFSISIHALTRSATIIKVVLDEINTISIHALTRSATTFRQVQKIPITISIHALTRSATE